MKKTALVLSLFAFAIGFCANATELPAPVVWFAMDETKIENETRIIEDISGNNRHLTLGDGCWLTNGIAGSALFFNGTEYAWSTFACPALGNRTISLTIKREQENGPLLEGETTYPYLFEKLSSMRIHFATKTDYQTVYLGSSSSATGTFTRERWHHLAWVWEQDNSEPETFSGTLSFYCDGNLVGTASLSPGTDPAVAATAILGNTSNKTRPIYASVDEVRIFDQALSAAQIKQEAWQSLDMETTKTAQLVAHWDMEQLEEAGDEFLARDISGNGIDLEIGSGCQVVDGVGGKGLHFNGTTDAYAVATRCPIVSSWSFSGWIKINSTLFENPPVEGNSYPRILAGSQSLMWYIRKADYRTWFQGYRYPSSEVHNIGIGPDLWTHYVLVNRIDYSAGDNHFTSTTEFYINGKKAATGAEYIVEDELFWRANSTLSFGNSTKNATRPFMGDFYDFRLYDGVLSEKEIHQLYQGLPTCSAGDNFTTADEQPFLYGSLKLAAIHPLRQSSGAALEWSIVSTPNGGQDTRILQPKSATTPVYLPVTGSYTFRLTASNICGTTSSDVVVTKVGSPLTNIVPTISLPSVATLTLPEPLFLSAEVADPDNAPGTLRVCWEKISGPGGVYFDTPNSTTTYATFLSPGTYQISCAATDGWDVSKKTITVTASNDTHPFAVTNGLVRFYPANEKPLNQEVISGNEQMSVPLFTEGISGYGLRSPGASDSTNTKLTLPEDGVASSAPTNITDLSFSFWMYHDTADTNISVNATLMYVAYTLGIYYHCQNEEPGFTLFQQGPGGSAMNYVFGAPEVSTKDRWTHVYANFDRAQGSELKLYIDGVQQTKTSSSGQKSGRVVNNPIHIGGGQVSIVGTIQGLHTNSVSGGYYSRTFPGVIDEFRIYDRELTASEITRLALQPYWLNRAPLSEILPAQIISGIIGDTCNIEAVVFDDDLPVGSEITCHWTVIDGSDDGLIINSPFELSTTVQLKELGTYTLQAKVTDGELSACSKPIEIRVNTGGTLLMIR